jgi:putative colanic acid biosynthesis UDP-glucose lipid carrier transferase
MNRANKLTVQIAYSKTCLHLGVLAGLRPLLAPSLSTLMLVVATRTMDVRFSEPYLALAIVSALLCALLIRDEESARNSFFPSSLTLVSQTGLAWLAVGGALLLLGYVTKTSDLFSRRVLLFWFVATFPVLVAAFLGQRLCLRLALMSKASARRAVIVGVNRMSAKLGECMTRRPELGLHFLGFVDDRSLDRIEGEERIRCQEPVGTLADLCGLVNRQRIEVVFVALPFQSSGTQSLLHALKDTTTSVYLIPNLSVFDLIQARSDEIQGVPVIALCESPFQGIQGLSKRLTDVVFSAVLLVAAAPLMLACALAIRLTSSGTVFFRQDRYGLDGQKIVVYKFRTMTVSENGNHVPQATRNDSRVTPIGRFLRRTSLDELPQLINVIQGRMSLVGPRPHAVAHNEEYRRLISGYMLRHKVVPGITGLAQVNGYRGETASLDDMVRRVKYDIEYIRRWCWLLDIQILVKTFVVVLFRRDRAY